VLPGPRRAGALEEGPGRHCSYVVIWPLPEKGRKGVGKGLQRFILTSFLPCLQALAEPFTGPNLLEAKKQEARWYDPQGSASETKSRKENKEWVWWWMEREKWRITNIKLITPEL